MHHVTTLFLSFVQSAAGYGLVLLLCANTLTAQATTLQTQPATQVQRWQQQLEQPDLTPLARFDLLLQLAAAYQAGGQTQQAQTTLNTAEALLPPDGEDLRRALLYNVYSDLALATREDSSARSFADRSMALLPSDAPALIRATVLNNVGNVQSVEAYYLQAEASYRAAAALAAQTDDIVLQAKVLTNLAQALFRQQRWSAMLDTLSQTQAQLAKAPLNAARTSGLLSVAELLLRLQERHGDELDDDTRQQIQALSTQVLQEAKQAANQLKLPRLQAYANGYLGRLAELTADTEAALSLTRQAIFFAQQVNALEILYRWQWQAARLFRQQGDIESALAAYREAVNHLEPVRQALTIGYRGAFQSFRDTVGPLYFELADLLLQQARRTPDTAKHWLLEARDTIERLKTAELQDYFQDDCIAGAPQTVQLGETSTPHTAVLYPIILPDRVEILLSLPQGMQQFQIPLTAERLKDEVNEFRFELETRDTRAYLPYAKRLYQWLIQPLEAALQAQAVQTLIIVPDGVLRTIPLAALHSGKYFLMQRYALVITPGLTLMQPPTTHAKPPHILLNGLSVSTQGYVALPSVAAEMQTIQALYPQSATVLMDEQFTEARFAEAVRDTPYDIIHIASHGQFDSNPDNTLLLTYDGRLTMNRLERLIRLSDIRNEPVDLLTLSACQTAVGDDQAALGLAGVALKAGARSALATLWFIDDEASALLVSEFYRQLQQGKVSKAQALQQAQLHLLRHSRYEHPAFWAPFLLIGNGL